MKLGQMGIATYYGDDVLVYDTVEQKYSRAGVLPYGLVTSHCGTNQTHIFCMLGEPRHGWNSNTEPLVQVAAVTWREGSSGEHSFFTGVSSPLKSDENKPPIKHDDALSRVMPHLTLPKSAAWSTYNLSRSTYTNVCFGPTFEPSTRLNESASWLRKWGLIEIDFESVK